MAGGFAVAVLLTVLIGFWSWRSAPAGGGCMPSWVAHTHAVMDTLKLTTKHAIEAETSGRAFAVTKQDAFLAHYETAKNAVARDMAALRHLTADNPQEQRQLDGLETQTGAAFAFAENIIAKRRQLQTRPDPSEMLETETLVNAISAASQEIRADEMTLFGGAHEKKRRTAATDEFPHCRWYLRRGRLVDAGLACRQPRD